jgi:hypothetical protein
LNMQSEQQHKISAARRRSNHFKKCWMFDITTTTK